MYSFYSSTLGYGSFGNGDRYVTLQEVRKVSAKADQMEFQHNYKK